MKQISDLHDLWCSLTQQDLNRKATERLFWQFHNEGFGTDDLSVVVKYMQRCNAKGGGRYKIAAHKVLGDTEVFASILAMAKAENRNHRPAPTPKEQVMQLRDPLLKTEEADPRINGHGRHLSDVLKKMAEQ